ncbi:twitching motility protein PilT [Deinococcus aetherius]|uniref:Twitching motility protein PilT n=1 Tax=Deinococcus aetherius TaxID=200252 RepID=A0ABN6R9P0_9DEIO|nr:type II toxin-antitoxin system VapC family toxin [Deinococcus aetherius]BDP40081.1 twitching motility protein PilT [Deinococcus aetherius]
MRLLLDTHILLWVTLKPDLLPSSLRARLLDPEHQIILSAVNAWEMSIKHHAGKLPEAAPLLTDFPAVAASLGAEVLNIMPAHAIRAEALDWAHRDPFDRMLVAQALEEGLRLVTLDESVTSYPQAPILR